MDSPGLIRPRERPPKSRAKSVAPRSPKVRPVTQHICSYCMKTFSTSMNLKTHLYQHTGDRPYTCAYCDYAATNMTNFQNHVRARHTLERPYQCLDCSKTFTEYKTWRTHADTHNIHATYACPHCNRAYKHSTSLLGHIRQKHRAEEIERRKTSPRRQFQTRRTRPIVRKQSGRREEERQERERNKFLEEGLFGSSGTIISEESVDTDLLLGALPEFTETEQNELLALMRHDSAEQPGIDIALPMLDQAVKIELDSVPRVWSQDCINSNPSPPTASVLATSNATSSLATLVAAQTVDTKPLVIYPSSLETEVDGDWFLLLPVSVSAAEELTAPLTVDSLTLG